MMRDRKAHWEAVYQNRSPLDVSWYQQEPSLSLDLIAQTGLAHDAPLIDIGGGASVLVDRLLQSGYTQLSVLDISARALACARQRLGAAAAQVRWLESDITAFVPPEQYALWHDRAVFHFLTEAADRQAYLRAVRAGLGVGGRLLIAAFAIGGPTRCSDLPIVQYDAAKLMLEFGDEFELVEQRQEVHVTPRQKEQLFAYFHLIRRSTAAFPS